MYILSRKSKRSHVWQFLELKIPQYPLFDSFKSLKFHNIPCLAVFKYLYIFCCLNVSMIWANIVCIELTNLALIPTWLIFWIDAWLCRMTSTQSTKNPNLHVFTFLLSSIFIDTTHELWVCITLQETFICLLTLTLYMTFTQWQQFVGFDQH